MTTLFISDLHLDPERPDIQEKFDQFIHSCLNNANQSNINTSSINTNIKNSSDIDALYILGDLFEVWLGDDASIPVYEHSIAQLKQLTDNNIKVYVMHGNRDFLMGSAFEQASGCKLIPDLYHLQVPNQQLPDQQETILLSHGDIFCTDDVEYMKFRNLVRNPQWQKDFLAKSISERIRIARSLREQSKQSNQEKHAEIMDVNQQMVESIMAEHKVKILIHGHTHRPATHDFIMNNQTIQRIVLPDWNPGAEVLEIG